MKAKPEGTEQTVSVLFPIPGGGPWTYRVPPDWESMPAPGCRVSAPLGRKILTGLVTGAGENVPSGVRLRALDVSLDSHPLVTPDLLELCFWLASYYFCEPGEALRSIMPGPFLRVGDRLVTLDKGKQKYDPAQLAAAQTRLLSLLEKRGRATASSLRRALGSGVFQRALAALESAGLVSVSDCLPHVPSDRTSTLVSASQELPGPEEMDRLLLRSPRQRECLEYLRGLAHPVESVFLSRKMGFGTEVVKALLQKGLARSEKVRVLRDPFKNHKLPPYEHPAPSDAQARIIKEISGKLDEHRVFLLHGVTGSGKTLVYLELLRPVLERDRQAIVLVPEIALTPQTTARFRGVFGDRVAVLHSGLSDGERYDIWREIRSGRHQVAVGPRSAVFAPFERLGLIIIDEEHESTYKQTDLTPRYHARDVAVQRMKLAGGPVLLGSATPSLESWAESERGDTVRLELPERVAGRALPSVTVSDLRRGWNGSDKNGVTPVLLKETGFALEAGGQVLVLLNRRGYSNFVLCVECGGIIQCPNCRISLTVHKRLGRLLCHYCGHQETPPEACPVCGSNALDRVGAGTEQVEAALREAFPDRMVDRMDMDTTGGKWSHHAILERLRTGATHILVGTQMIAKGLDFPDVLLVGVVNADTAMNLPDFRATERTFQLLAQVAGRTGRGERGGEVLIQTFNPSHPAVRAAVNHDYARFARRELQVRREAGYPPYVRLLNVIFSGEEERTVERFAADSAQLVSALVRRKGLGGRLEILGPAPCALERLRQRWRFHIMLKSREAELIGSVGEFLARRLKPPSAGACRVTLDRDPVSLM